MTAGPPLQLALMAAAALGGYLYWQHWFGAYRIKDSAYSALIILGTVLAVAGGHLAYMAAHGISGATARNMLLTLDGWRAGYLSPGVVAGFGLAIVLVSLIYRVKLLYLADVVTPAILGFSVVWRIGCWFDGCCYGIATTMPWGVVPSHKFVPAGAAQLVHPTQLYAGGAGLVLFLLAPYLMRWAGTTPGRGIVAAMCIFGYALARLVIDHFRVGASLDPVAFGLAVTQLISLITIAVLGPVIWLLVRQQRLDRHGRPH